MFFQILDDKKECTTIYHDGELREQHELLALTHTWSPSSVFEEIKECAYIWCEGRSLDEVCPEDLKQEWLALNGKARAYFNSFTQARINLTDVCFYDLVPSNFLMKFYDMKNKIT